VEEALRIKTPFVAAVSLNKEGHPIAMKMTVVEGFKTEVIRTWSQNHIEAGSMLFLTNYRALREL